MTDANFDFYVPILKADDEEQFILGPVLVPDQEDSQGDVVSREEIRNAAHRFLEHYNTLNLMHERPTTVAVVESFIAPQDLQLGGQIVRSGTWLLGAHVNDADVWAKVKSGHYRGFSIEGYAERVPVDADSSPDSP